MFLDKVTKWLGGIILMLCALFVLLYFTMLRNSYYQPGYAQRKHTGAAWRTKGITLAVVWPAHDDVSFVHGVQLALEEANASKAHHLNRGIRIKQFTEGPDESRWSGANMAHLIAWDSDIVAVLGHEFSSSAVPASLTYENRGLLFLTPKSTDPHLTQHGFRYTFRLTPNDQQIAVAMTKFAAGRGWKNIGVYSARNAEGESMEHELIEAASENGLNLVFSRSYLPYEERWEEMDFRPLIATEARETVDGIMIADQLPRGAKLITDLRKMGINVPIMASDKLDSELLWEEAKEAANNVYVASAVDPDSTGPAFLCFKESFVRRWGQNPGYGASQGYESFWLLMNAIWESDSAEPIIVATTIRDGKWKGLFGDFSFTPEGDIEGRHISIKRQENGRLTTVPN
jgi:branched-chain amino acid transport system substrate-binding protein